MSGKKIFYVDDNLTSLMAGKNALKGNYDAFTMPSVEKMFELLQKIRPDAILLDVEMPETSGREALQRLKESEWRDIPVAFVTGNEDDADEKECRMLGAKEYIRKPFTADVILAALDRLFA